MSDTEDRKDDVTAGPEIAIETDAGGIPTGKPFRSYALGMIGRARNLQFITQDALVLAALRPRGKRDSQGRLMDPSEKEWQRVNANRGAARAVLDALVRSGRMVLLDQENPDRVPTYRYVPPPERLKPDTPEARQENYLASSRSIGRRVGRTEQSQAKVTDLYLKIRKIYGLHRVGFREGRAVVVPCAIAVGAGGPSITEALVIAALPNGLKLYEAKGEAIVTRFGEANELVIELDPAKCAKWRRLLVSAENLTVSPFAADNQMGTHNIAKLAKGVLDGLKGQREGVSNYVGEELDKAAWLSFLASTRRASALNKYVRTTVFSILDREVRAACLRDPRATYELYNWFCGSSELKRTRRLQASAAYPYLTSILRELEDVIDRGEPLAPILAQRFSASSAVIKHLRHLKWQSVGSPHAVPIGGHEFTDLLDLLSRIVPEDLPIGRKAWTGAVNVSNTLVSTFGGDLPPNLANATRRLGSTSKLVGSGFGDAMNDIVGVLMKATSLKWQNYAIHEEIGFHDFEDARGKSRNLHQAIATAVASAIAGEPGSIKRLASFNNDWHRGVARRLASFNAIKRRALGEETRVWQPLTKGPIKLAGGQMRWICDEDTLAFEGREMRHCVGTYSPQCFSGASHIASVVGPSGIRSTVEFRIREKSIVLGQHYTYRDRQPPEENVAVVRAFMDMVRSRKSLIDFKALAKAAERRVKAHEKRKPKGSMSTVMTPEDAESLIRLYDDCLPKSLHGMTVEDWKTRLAEFMRRRPKQERADESPLDRMRRMTECQQAA